MRAYELIGNPAKFTRGNYALNREGRFTNPCKNPESGICLAEKWDIMGALQNIYSYENVIILIKEIEQLVIKIKDNAGSNKYTNWSNFNDSAPYTEIIQVLQSIEEKFNLKINEQ